MVKRTNRKETNLMIVQEMLEPLNVNEKTDIFVYILEHTEPKTRLFIEPVSSIHRHTGYSLTAVQNALKKLESMNVISKVPGGWKLRITAKETDAPSCPDKMYYYYYA